jgi:hypothetical protein
MVFMESLEYFSNGGKCCGTCENNINRPIQWTSLEDVFGSESWCEVVKKSVSNLGFCNNENYVSKFY